MSNIIELKSVRFGIEIVRLKGSRNVTTLDTATKGEEGLKLAYDVEKGLLIVQEAAGQKFLVPVTNIRTMVPLAPHAALDEKRGPGRPKKTDDA